MTPSEEAAILARSIALETIDRAKRRVNAFGPRPLPRDATERTLYQAFDIMDGTRRGVEWETGADAMAAELERLRYAVCEAWTQQPTDTHTPLMMNILGLQMAIVTLESLGDDMTEERTAWDAAWDEYQQTYDYGSE